MGFVIVEYQVVLSREDVAKLILDSSDVEVTTQDGENIVIMGSGTVHKVVHPENTGFSHLFNTSVFFKDHQKHLWSSVSLSSKDKIVYHATVSPVQLF